jgi:hypothetical protein
MERLTESNPSWIDDELWERACEPDCEEIDAVYRKLKDYEDLEEQGRLLVLPCKIGDRLYWIDDEDDDGNKGLCIKQYNEDEKVQAIGIDKDGDIFVMLGIDEFFTAPDTIGSQYALLTLEDANKMLAEMKKNESEE